MSETVSAKYQITQIIIQWVPGSWAGNSKCPTHIWAETVPRHVQRGNNAWQNKDAVTITWVWLKSPPTVSTSW